MYRSILTTLKVVLFATLSIYIHSAYGISSLGGAFTSAHCNFTHADNQQPLGCQCHLEGDKCAPANSVCRLTANGQGKVCTCVPEASANGQSCDLPCSVTTVNPFTPTPYYYFGFIYPCLPDGFVYNEVQIELAGCQRPVDVRTVLVYDENCDNQANFGSGYIQCPADKPRQDVCIHNPLLISRKRADGGYDLVVGNQQLYVDNLAAAAGTHGPPSSATQCYTVVATAADGKQSTSDPFCVEFISLDADLTQGTTTVNVCTDFRMGLGTSVRGLSTPPQNLASNKCP